MLKKLISLLPISRRKHNEVIHNLALVLDGLIEAEANHCQIEMSLIQKLQQGEGQKTTAKKSKSPLPNDPAFM